MNDQNKKVNPEETPKSAKIELTDEQAEMIAGGWDAPIPTWLKKPREKPTVYAGIYI